MLKRFAMVGLRWLVIIVFAVNFVLAASACDQKATGGSKAGSPPNDSPTPLITQTQVVIPATKTVPAATPTQAPTQTEPPATTIPPTAMITGTVQSPTPVGLTIGPQNAANLQQIGEAAPVQAIDFAWLDGGRVLAIATQTELLAYRLAQGTEIDQTPAVSPTQIVASSVDGWVAWTSQDQTVHLWQAAQGGSAQALPGIKEDVTSLAFSPGGSTLAAATYTNKIELFSTQTGGISATWELPFWMSNLAYSPDGSQLAGVDQSNFTAHILDARTGKEQRSLAWKDSASPVLYGAFFSPDWHTLAWIARGTVQLMGGEKGELGATLNHEDFVNAFSWSPDSRLIAVSTAATIEGNFQPVIVIWDAASAQIVKTLSLEEPVTRMSFSPDGRSLATLTGSGKIKIWGLAP